MARYTTDNTEGYTTEQLNELNRLYDARLATDDNWTPNDLHCLTEDTLSDYDAGVRTIGDKLKRLGLTCDCDADTLAGECHAFSEQEDGVRLYTDVSNSSYIVGRPSVD